MICWKDWDIHDLTRNKTQIHGKVFKANINEGYIKHCSKRVENKFEGDVNRLRKS